MLAIKHRHPCDLNTHTLAECSRLAKHDHALEWGAETLATASVFVLTYAALAPLARTPRASRGAVGARA